MTLEPGDRSPESGDFDDHWHSLLTGDPSALPGLSKYFRRLPSPPRCKACGVPFAGPYTPFLRMLRFKPWQVNQQLCKWCFEGIGKQRGGAEVPVSVLFGDVRDSTRLAEQMTPGEFKSLLERFIKTVVVAVDTYHGVVDHIVGDGVMAMWTPAFGGPNHPELAVGAGRRLLTDMASDPILGRTLPAGVGVHTGMAWVGIVGETGTQDFTVLGDVPNTVARLGSITTGGELAMSGAIVKAADVDTGSLEQRLLDLKGKAEPFPAWIEKAPIEAT